jgi:hypothetical protein
MQPMAGGLSNGWSAATSVRLSRVQASMPAAGLGNPAGHVT